MTIDARAEDTSDSAVRRAVSPRTHFLGPRQTGGKQLGLPGRDLLYPKYSIRNKAAYLPSWNADRGGISNMTLNTDIIHQNGLAEYDVHNLYGTSKMQLPSPSHYPCSFLRHSIADGNLSIVMSSQCRDAMLKRRPSLRPLIITRSTFAGAGAKVGKWLGDNLSTWDHYRLSIRSMLAFSTLYQMPVTGVDVCGFGGNTTEQLCARWAMLGAFAPFYRSHNEYRPTIPQEFYRWPVVTEAARKAIEIRYRLLDYIYTAMHIQTVDGTPLVQPLFFKYPNDPGTFGLELQYFYGPSLLVAPVPEENATFVDIYFPNDIFYDWYTHKKIQGQGKNITISDQSLTDIPLYLRGGVVIPTRIRSAMTTKELREQDFELLVPVDADGKAEGRLYLDDGVSLVQNAVTDVTFRYARGVLTAKGKFGFNSEVNIKKVTVIGAGKVGKNKGGRGGAEGKSIALDVDQPLTGEFAITLDLEE